MNDTNPYQAPTSNVGLGDQTNALDEKTFKHLAYGQKMTIYSILVYFLLLTSIARVSSSGVAMGGALLVLLALILGLVGMIRVLMGAEMGIVSKILLFIAMFVPVLNLIALARISSTATNRLREAGYKVGFMGVKGGYAG